MDFSSEAFKSLRVVSNWKKKVSEIGMSKTFSVSKLEKRYLNGFCAPGPEKKILKGLYKCIDWFNLILGLIKLL